MAPVLGSSSTALQALQGVNLTGKTAVITGQLFRGPQPLRHLSGTTSDVALATGHVLPKSTKAVGACNVLTPAGGNSGLGVETARAMAHAGARVILTSRKVEAGQRVAQELQTSGVKVSLKLLTCCCLLSWAGPAAPGSVYCCCRVRLK